MENQEKLELVIAKIKAVKGNLRGKRDRLKYYTESLEYGRFNQITLEQIENFDFEREVINKQKTLENWKGTKQRIN